MEWSYKSCPWRKKHLEIKKVLLFIKLCQTSYCPNLEANKQIPFDFQKVIQTLIFKGSEKFDKALIWYVGV